MLPVLLVIVRTEGRQSAVILDTGVAAVIQIAYLTTAAVLATANTESLSGQIMSLQ